jgi:mono/diheme cytochrome c family protein
MYADIILEGKRAGQGMPGFKQWLNASDIDAIRAYVLKRRADLAGSKQP